MKPVTILTGLSKCGAGTRLCLRVKSIGAGARRTVREDGDGPRFVLYQDRQERRPTASPVRQTEEAATPDANKPDLFAAEAAE
jgi:catechol 2,3-dioxygenase-like lactoylglutathione lyase family enzyme